jgi:hypothetical protein
LRMKASPLTGSLLSKIYLGGSSKAELRGGMIIRNFRLYCRSTGGWLEAHYSDILIRTGISSLPFYQRSFGNGRLSVARKQTRNTHFSGSGFLRNQRRMWRAAAGFKSRLATSVINFRCQCRRWFLLGIETPPSQVRDPFILLHGYKCGGWICRRCGAPLSLHIILRTRVMAMVMRLTWRSKLGEAGRGTCLELRCNPVIQRTFRRGAWLLCAFGVDKKTTFYGTLRWCRIQIRDDVWSIDKLGYS